MKCLCCILNYNNNENADFLYSEFNKYCKACVLDSDSNNPYPYFENVGNFYYTNLFNKSIEKFKNGNYTNLIIITSDVIIDKDVIKHLSDIGNNDMNNIGIYNIQSDKNSKDYHNHFDNIYKHKLNDDLTYDTNLCEGFLNIYHHDVVMLHENIPLNVNKYGVFITYYSCKISKLLDKKIIVDTKYTLFHPYKKGYDFKESHDYYDIFNKWYTNEINKIKSNLKIDLNLLNEKYKEKNKYFDSLCDNTKSREIIFEDINKHFKTNNISNPICVEIGSFRGNFSEKIIEYLNPSILYLIDPYISDYDDNSELKKESEIYFEYNYQYIKDKFKNNKNVKIIRKKSLEAVSEFKSLSIDFIYIDGNNNDLKNWYSKLKYNGIISGHDYCDNVKKDINNFFNKDFNIVNSCIKQWYHIKENKHIYIHSKYSSKLFKRSFNMTPSHKKITIWKAYHKESQIKKYDLFENERIYLFNTTNLGYTGKNINHLNRLFCEGVCILYPYFNNIKSDIIGFQHYRRWYHSDYNTLKINEIKTGKIQVFQNRTIKIIDTNEKYKFISHFFTFWRMNNIFYNDCIEYLSNNYPEYLKEKENIYKFHGHSLFVCNWDKYIKFCELFWGYLNFISDKYRFDIYNENDWIEFIKEYFILYNRNNKVPTITLPWIPNIPYGHDNWINDDYINDLESFYYYRIFSYILEFFISIFADTEGYIYDENNKLNFI